MARENEIDYRPAWTPYGSISGITPSDTATLATVCRRLWVGAAGNVVVRLLDGSTPTYIAGTGTMLDVGQFDQIRAATNVASPTTNLVALY